MTLVDIFLDPAKAFTALKERPTFLLPTAMVIAAAAAAMLAYFLRVDPAWYQDFALGLAAQDMTAAEIAQARQFMPSARTQGYIAAGSMFVVMPLLYAIFAVYYFLAAKIAGAALGYRHALSLTAWGAMPTLLGAVVALVGALTMAPQTPQHALNLTYLDPLLVQLPFDHALSGIAKGFNLLTIWAIAVSAIGWKVLARSGWTAAVVVAALPTVLVYGIWLLVALL